MDSNTADEMEVVFKKREKSVDETKRKSELMCLFLIFSKMES